MMEHKEDHKKLENSEHAGLDRDELAPKVGGTLSADSMKHEKDCASALEEMRKAFGADVLLQLVNERIEQIEDDAEAAEAPTDQPDVAAGVVLESARKPEEAESEEDPIGFEPEDDFEEEFSDEFAEQAKEAILEALAELRDEGIEHPTEEQIKQRLSELLLGEEAIADGSNDSEKDDEQVDSAIELRLTDSEDCADRKTPYGTFTIGQLRQLVAPAGLAALYTATCTDGEPIGEIPIILPCEDKKNVVIITVPYIRRVTMDDFVNITDAETRHWLFNQNMEAFELTESTHACLKGFAESLGLNFHQKTVGSKEELMKLRDEYQQLVREGGTNAVRAEIKPQRSDGYYDDTKEYVYYGKVYHEGDVIWSQLTSVRSSFAQMRCFRVNLDDLPEYMIPVDSETAQMITGPDPHYGYFPHEQAFMLARDFAAKQKTVGTAIVCVAGHFYVPCQRFYNPYAELSEDLLTIFNAKNCNIHSHLCACVLISDIGNVHMETSVMYKKAAIYDWKKRLDQELKVIEQDDPGFDIYGDPYDDQENADY